MAFEPQPWCSILQLTTTTGHCDPHPRTICMTAPVRRPYFSAPLMRYQPQSTEAYTEGPQRGTSSPRIGIRLPMLSCIAMLLQQRLFGCPRSSKFDAGLLPGDFLCLWFDAFSYCLKYKSASLYDTSESRWLLGLDINIVHKRRTQTGPRSCC